MAKTKAARSKKPRSKKKRAIAPSVLARNRTK